MRTALLAFSFGTVLCGCLVSFDREFDFDEDGVLSSADCNDEDASAYPGAIEKCADGVDQDCNGVTDDCDPTDDSRGNGDDDDTGKENNGNGNGNGNGNNGNGNGNGNGGSSG